MAGPEPWLRGLPPGYTQILINGEKVPGANADRSFFLDRIPAELIDRVEIERPDRVLLRSTDAFRIVEKSQIATKENEREHATPFMIPGTATWGIHEMEDITAVEAVYSMSQLGIFA